MAQDKLAAQRQTVLDEEERKTYMQNPAEHWSAFYRKHNSSFFRDRKWLAQEFPEIFSLTQADVRLDFFWLCLTFRRATVSW